ncbi:MAG: hypothetical protein R2845_13570 [Thermomicrobiales bacterium]
MTIGETGQTIRRWWWLLLLLPLIGLVSGFVMTRDQQYESSFRATILIPGDTEIPGSAERPELMVMDDAPSLIESRAFAEMTWAALPDDAQAVLAVEDVQDALSATRYSRVLTVVASREDPAQAEAIAAAVASVLSLTQSINIWSPIRCRSATVQVIDPPGRASKDTMERYTQGIAAQAAAALVFAIVLALMLDAASRRVARSVIVVRKIQDCSANS